MSVGLLIITHSPLGGATLAAASGTLGSTPLPVAVLDITPDDDPQQQQQRAEALLLQLDEGDGVLILTDLYGATPSNIASRLLQQERKVCLLSGLSLPMLIRTMNYPDLPLEELAQKAQSGAHDGILLQPGVAPEGHLEHA
jgi:PTS system mannose-specific IIA component